MSGNENAGGRRPRVRAAIPALAARLCLVAVWAAAVRADQADKRADELFETAMSAFKLGRYEDAGTKFYDFMAASPNDPRNDRAQYYAGRCQMHRNYLNKAIEEFSYVVEDFPQSPYANLSLHDLAQCYLATRETEKAVKSMEALIGRPVRIYHGDEDPMLKQLYENQRADVFWLAKHYLDNKQYAAAIAAYRKLPHEIEAFRYTVEVYYGLGDFEKIRGLIDTLQETNRHEGFKFLIEFYARSKAFNQVKDIFAKLLEEKNPTLATDDLVWTTAVNFNNFGIEHWDWAMRRISASYPRLARRAEYHLIRHHWQQPDYQDDMELFVINYKSGGDVDEVLRWKGIALEQAGRAEEARKDYRRMGNTGQGHWYAAETFHGRYARARDLKAAIEEYRNIRKAFYSMEWAAMAGWRVAELYRSLNAVTNAVDEFRQVAKRFGQVTIGDGRDNPLLRENLGRNEIAFGPEALLAAGDILREAKMYDDAIAEYKGLVSKYPKTLQAALGGYRSALCYEGMNDRETAVAVLKSVLRRFPSTPGASEAHTRLETVYKIADTEVTDAVDVFGEGPDRRNYMEAPEKMKRR